MAGRRRRAQTIHHDHPMRHAIEEPQTVGHVRARLTEEQPLREVGAAGEFDLAFLPLVRIAGQCVEAFAVLGSGAEHAGVRVEPAQQPGVDVRRGETSRFHTGIHQPAGEAVADRGQRLLGRLAAPRGRGRGRAAVDDHAHAPDLAAPRQARHGSILEQATRLGDGPQVMGEETQVEVAECAALRTRLQIVRQRAQIVVPVGLVLGIELHHPGVVVQLIKSILKRVLQRIARLPQPGHLAALGADRRQLEEGRHRLAIFQQHALGFGQVLDPGQQVRE